MSLAGNDNSQLSVAGLITLNTSLFYRTKQGAFKKLKLKRKRLRQ
jgi:hypothetical protein